MSKTQQGTKPTNPEPLLTAAEVADLLRSSVKTVRRLTRAGHLPSYHLGRLVRYRASDLEAWLSRNRRAAIQIGDIR